MATPEQVRASLILVTAAAVSQTTEVVTRLGSDPEVAREGLLEAVPAIVGFYSDGSAALAADYYDTAREAATARARYVAEPVVDLREERLRRAVVWGVDPLFAEQPDEPDVPAAAARIGSVVQLETASAFRDTITTNTNRDPSAVGWKRITSGGCKFCQMLAGRGAIYKQATATFASHPNCDCSAAPVFDGEAGEEASVLQYVASKRRTSDRDRARIRAWLAGQA